MEFVGYETSWALHRVMFHIGFFSVTVTVTSNGWFFRQSGAVMDMSECEKVRA
jgi:hypothetical protein